MFIPEVPESSQQPSTFLEIVQMLSRRQARDSIEAVRPELLPYAEAASVGAVEGEEEGGSLSPEQKQRWLQHIQSGQLPYRKDCEVCVRGSATGLQHRRCVYKDTLVLSFDLAGPFSESGRSYDSAGFKYLLVAGFRVPAELLRTSDPSKSEVLPSEKVKILVPTQDLPSYQLLRCRRRTVLRWTSVMKAFRMIWRRNLVNLMWCSKHRCLISLA